MTLVRVEYEPREMPPGRPTQAEELETIALGAGATVVEHPDVGVLTADFDEDHEARSFAGRLLMQAAIVHSVTFPNGPPTTSA